MIIDIYGGGSLGLRFGTKSTDDRTLCVCARAEKERNAGLTALNANEERNLGLKVLCA